MPDAFQTRKLEIRRYRSGDQDDVWALHHDAIERVEALDAGDDLRTTSQGPTSNPAGSF